MKKPATKFALMTACMVVLAAGARAQNNVGVGTITPTSMLHVNGSLATGSTATTLTAAATLDATYNTVPCNTTAGGFTLTLPGAATCKGRIYNITKLDESSNPITFSASVTVASTTITSTNVPGTITIQSDGVKWVKIN